jgi:hypothetical protein
MISLKRNKLWFTLHEVWFNKLSAPSIGRGLSYYEFFQTSKLSIEDKELVLDCKKFTTTVLDLKHDEADLFKSMDYKSCRYEINKALKLEKTTQVEIYSNKYFGDFIETGNSFFSYLELNNNLSRKQLNRYVDSGCGELRVLIYDNDFLGGNFYLLDNDSGIVRLLYSFNKRHKDKNIKKYSGSLMRLLHWRSMLNYKEQGYTKYDFGGVTLDKNASTYSIGKFKRSFGGDIEETYKYVITKSLTVYLFSKVRVFINRYK